MKSEVHYIPLFLEDPSCRHRFNLCKPRFVYLLQKEFYIIVGPKK